MVGDGAGAVPTEVIFLLWDAQRKGMIIFMVSMEVGTLGSELLVSNSSATFRAATRMSPGDGSWSDMTALVMKGGIAMALVKCLIVGLASFATSRSSAFVTCLLCSNLESQLCYILK